MARHIPADAGQQLALDFGFDAEAQRAIDIELIHQATGIYTTRPEVDALLSLLQLAVRRPDAARSGLRRRRCSRRRPGPPGPRPR